MIRTIRVGDHFPDLLHHGPLLPVGTELSGGWRHLAPGVWIDASGMPLTSYASQTTFILRFLPDDQQEVTLPAESRGAFLWRLRDAAFASAERSSITLHPVEELCASFGAPTPRLVVGGTVCSNHDAISLPQGSLLYVGHPSIPKQFGVMRVIQRRLDPVLGRGRAQGEAMTIYSTPTDASDTLPGLEKIADEPLASEAELATIALRAWRMGKTYKRRYSWCGAFESSLAALGIDEATIAATGETPLGVGDEVTPSRAALLPENTLLFHQWRLGGFTVYQRRNSATRTTARTVRLCGDAEHPANSHTYMTIAWVPGDPMHWVMPGSELTYLPDGVRFSQVDASEIQTLNEQTRANTNAWSAYVVHHYPGVNL